MTKDTPTTVRERLRDFIRVCYGDDAWNEKFTDGVLSIFHSEQKALLERLYNRCECTENNYDEYCEEHIFTERLDQERKRLEEQSEKGD